MRTSAHTSAKFFQNAATLARNHWGKLIIGTFVAANVAGIALYGRHKDTQLDRMVAAAREGREAPDAPPLGAAGAAVRVLSGRGLS